MVKAPFVGSPTRSMNVTLANILWTVLVLLVVLWLIGLIGNMTGGGLIHLLLVVAVIILIYNLLVGRRTV